MSHQVLRSASSATPPRAGRSAAPLQALYDLPASPHIVLVAGWLPPRGEFSQRFLRAPGSQDAGGASEHEVAQSHADSPLARVADGVGCLVPLRLLAHNGQLSADQLCKGIALQLSSLRPEPPASDGLTPPAGAVLKVQTTDLFGVWRWSLRYPDASEFLGQDEDSDVLLAALQCVAAQLPVSGLPQREEDEPESLSFEAPRHLARLIRALCDHDDDRVRREAGSLMHYVPTDALEANSRRSRRQKTEQ